MKSKIRFICGELNRGRITAHEAADRLIELLSTHIPIDKAKKALCVLECGHSMFEGCTERNEQCSRVDEFLSALGVNDKKEG